MQECMCPILFTCIGNRQEIDGKHHHLLLVIKPGTPLCIGRQLACQDFKKQLLTLLFESLGFGGLWETSLRPNPL